MNYRIAVNLGLCAGPARGEGPKMPMPAGFLKPGERAVRPEAPAAPAQSPYGHGGLRTVRLGGEARRSAARRDLAAVRAVALLCCQYTG
jgi:hypothetical protein